MNMIKQLSLQPINILTGKLRLALVAHLDSGNETTLINEYQQITDKQEQYSFLEDISRTARLILKTAIENQSNSDGKSTISCLLCESGIQTTMELSEAEQLSVLVPLVAEYAYLNSETTIPESYQCPERSEAKEILSERLSDIENYAEAIESVKILVDVINSKKSSFEIANNNISLIA